jgi:putative ABC transport system ATP-binding protein
MIRLTDLHLTLSGAAGAVNVLRGIDLEVAPGEQVGIVGPSGSGKTSMLMVVAGLERPSAGLAEVAGQNLGSLDEDGLAAFRRANLGIVFQAFHLIPTMTALENVAVALELDHRADATARARDALDAVGLSHRLGHYPAELSGGEQQRVALARAVAGEPRLLLADEPTGNLDRETGQRIIDLMQSLARSRGATLLLITHDPGVTAHCHRVFRLVDGRIASGLADGAA